MAGTIIVDRIESDASYASTINVAAQVTFSNTVNFGVSSVAPVAGVYSPSTNNLAFTTASTERMRIDSAGNVGIGTDSPAGKLDVRGSSYFGVPNTFIIGDDGGSTGAFLNETSSLPMRFLTAGTERMRISAAGVVQVGNNAGTGEVFAQNTVKAWGVINSGSVTFYNSFGASSVSKISTGIYAIGFTRTLSSSRFGSAVNPYGGGFAFINTESTTGCRININNTTNTYVDGDVMFLIAGGS
jgi:hypothetical protein